MYGYIYLYFRAITLPNVWATGFDANSISAWVSSLTQHSTNVGAKAFSMIFGTPTTPRYLSKLIRCHTLGRGVVFWQTCENSSVRSGPTSLITRTVGTPSVSISDSKDVSSLFLLARLCCVLDDVSTIFDNSVFCWSSWSEDTGLHRWRFTRGVVFPFIHDDGILSRDRKINLKSEQELGTVFYV